MCICIYIYVGVFPFARRHLLPLGCAVHVDSTSEKEKNIYFRSVRSKDWKRTGRVVGLEGLASKPWSMFDVHFCEILLFSFWGSNKFWFKPTDLFLHLQVFKDFFSASTNGPFGSFSCREIGGAFPEMCKCVSERAATVLHSLFLSLPSSGYDINAVITNKFNASFYVQNWLSSRRYFFAGPSPLYTDARKLIAARKLWHFINKAREKKIN